MSGNEMVTAGGPVVVHQELEQLSVNRIVADKRRIQEVMAAVMKKDVHYGIVPGTPKPSLWKPGAETLLSLFRIAVDPRAEDLSTLDAIRYRVTAVATHSVTGACLGSAIGECSSDEEKYRWRAAVCKEEFDETAVDRKRKKWKKGWNKEPARAIEQVRTEPADIANTVLKMAAKRAEIAVTLRVTGASDIFAQDLEDLPAEVVAEIVGDEEPARPPVKMPEKKAAAPASAPPPQQREPGQDDEEEEPRNGVHVVDEIEMKPREGKSPYWLIHSGGKTWATFHASTGEKLRKGVRFRITKEHTGQFGQIADDFEIVP